MITTPEQDTRNDTPNVFDLLKSDMRKVASLRRRPGPVIRIARKTHLSPFKQKRSLQRVSVITKPAQASLRNLVPPSMHSSSPRQPRERRHSLCRLWMIEKSASTGQLGDDAAYVLNEPSPSFDLPLRRMKQGWHGTWKYHPTHHVTDSHHEPSADYASQGS